MSCLVFLTKTFPFEKGEYFIDNEIKHLCKAFDKVIICTCAINDMDSHSRVQLPENVTCVKITSRKMIDKIRIGLKMPFHFFMKEDRQKAASFRNKLKRSMIYCSSLLIFKKLQKPLKQLLKNENNLVFYSYWMYDTAIALIKLSEVYGGKVVARAHRYDLYENESNGYIPFRKLILSKAKVFPCSKNGEKYLTENYPECEHKIKHSYLGTDDYGIQECKRTEVLKICSCSNIIAIKRIDLLIMALKEVKKQVKIKWIHYGSGQLSEQIKQLAEANLSDDEYEFCGTVENKKLMKAYANSTFDVFVNVSSGEGLPVSIMEASSFGLPIIATDVGGTSEIVKHGLNGFLLKSNFEIKELVQNLLKIARFDDSAYFKLRESSRKIWEENFSAEKNYNEFIKWLL